MTGPNTPEDAITRAAQRIAATRQATRALSEEVAAKRQTAAEGQAAPAAPDDGRP